MSAERAALTRDEQLLSVPAPAGAASDLVWLDRVRAELAEGLGALAGVTRAVTVFGSARTPPDDPDYELARALTSRLGRDGYSIITGGGPGIMEAANRGARDVAAQSIGLPIELPFEEIVNEYLDICVRFRHFFTRKVMFVRYASAFLVFPGGFGTLDELFELVTLIQTRKLHAPPLVLMRSGYWGPVLAWLRDSVLDGGKISPEDLDLITFADDLDHAHALIDASGRI